MADGNWSTFLLQVGIENGGQQFRALVSTSSYSNWLPTPLGCFLDVLQLGPSNTPTSSSSCDVSRGVGLFDGVQSFGFIGSRSDTYTSFNEKTLTDLWSQLIPSNIFGSGYNASGVLGLDYIALGISHDSNAENGTVISPNHIPILGIDNVTNILPTIGIGLYAIESSDFIARSLVSSLVDGGVIPSQSWGYTAEASYSKLIALVMTLYL